MVIPFGRREFYATSTAAAFSVENAPAPRCRGAQKQTSIDRKPSNWLVFASFFAGSGPKTPE
jgi:hypothetical protein